MRAIAIVHAQIPPNIWGICSLSALMITELWHNTMARCRQVYYPLGTNLEDYKFL